MLKDGSDRSNACSRTHKDHRKIVNTMSQSALLQADSEVYAFVTSGKRMAGNSLSLSNDQAFESDT
jgi:hypothetical protein